MFFSYNNPNRNNILHTGDFKIDYTPIDGKVMNLQRISNIGSKGVLLLMADSTNVEIPGHSPSEKSIEKTLNKLFINSRGKNNRCNFCLKYT